MSKDNLSRRLDVLEQRSGGGENRIWVIFHEIVRPDRTIVRGDVIRSHDGAFSLKRAQDEADEDFESRALNAAEQFARASGHAVMIFHEAE
jgi:hypothetical protein